MSLTLLNHETRQGLEGPDAGRLFRHKEPFPFIRIPNLLSPDAFSRLARQSREGITWACEDGDKDRVEFAACTSIDFVQLVYGRRFKDLMKSAFGLSLVRPPGAVPQLRRVQGPASGIPVHNDAVCGRDALLFFYLNDDWRPEHGGELVLWETESGGRQIVVPPEANSMVILFPGENAWHSVRPLVGNWERVNVLVEWKSEGGSFETAPR